MLAPVIALPFSSAVHESPEPGCQQQALWGPCCHGQCPAAPAAQLRLGTAAGALLASAGGVQPGLQPRPAWGSRMKPESCGGSAGPPPILHGNKGPAEPSGDNSANASENTRNPRAVSGSGVWVVCWGSWEGFNQFKKLRILRKWVMGKPRLVGILRGCLNSSLTHLKHEPNSLLFIHLHCTLC